MKRYILPALLLLFALFLYSSGYLNNTLIIILVAGSAAGFAFASSAVRGVIRGAVPKSIVAPVIKFKWFFAFFLAFLLIVVIVMNPTWLQVTPTTPTKTTTTTTTGGGTTNTTTPTKGWVEVDNISGSGTIDVGGTAYDNIQFSHQFTGRSYKIEHTRKWDWDVPRNMAGNGDTTWSLINPNNSTCWSTIDYIHVLQWEMQSTSCRYTGDQFTHQIVNNWDAKVIYDYYIVLFEWV